MCRLGRSWGRGPSSPPPPPPPSPRVTARARAHQASWPRPPWKLSPQSIRDRDLKVLILNLIIYSMRNFYDVFVTGAGKHALPLPLQVTSLSGKQTQAGPEPSLQFPSAAPRDPGGPACAVTNPFVTDSFHSESGPVSLCDPRHQSQAPPPGPGHRRIASADTQTFHRWNLEQEIGRLG